MKKLIFIFVFGLLSWIQGYTQEKIFNQRIYDTVAKKEILIGYCNRQGLMSDLFASYFNDEYAKYKPEESFVSEINGLLEGLSITIVMGTWCSDSQEQVPRFFKIVDSLKDLEKRITIICVDKNKKVGPVSLEGMNITKVPTFIFYRYGIEVGRITETPVNSLEKDMFTILSQ
jgi:hypothetical protein